MEKLGQTEYRQLAERIEKYLQPLAEELGVAISIGRGKYRKDEHASIPIEIQLPDPSGTVMTKQEKEFRQYANMFGLSPDDFGKQFVSRSSTYTICGLNLKAQRYPINAVNQNGRKYKFPASEVIRHLGKTAPLRPGTRTQLFNSRKEEDIIADFRRVECALSPENLSCDGEKPRHQIQKDHARLMRERIALVRELGREPTMEELYPNLYAKK